MLRVIRGWEYNLGAHFPRGFTDDWMRVAAEESMHFAMLDRRLRQLGSFYGAHPAHDGL